MVKIIFEIIGIIITCSFFITGLYYTFKSRKGKKYSGKTYGKIISYRTKYDFNDKRRYYYALCEYIVGETKCVRETNDLGTWQPKYKIGEKVTVYYNPNNCHEAYIEGENNTKIRAIISFILGIITSIFIYLASKFFF